MKFFDRFKKKTLEIESSENILPENIPSLLGAKILFINKPDLEILKIKSEAEKYFSSVEISSTDPLMFIFPDIKVDLLDSNGPAQCVILKSDKVQLPDNAFQQNWHWTEGNEVAERCNHEFVITDILSRTIDYKKRLDLFNSFLVSVIDVTNPDVIYSVTSQKLISSSDLKEVWSKPEKHLLYSCCNIRLYKIEDSKENSCLMDTIGLHALGLPDFQIVISNTDLKEVSSLLWDYAYYIYENGDIIESGSTIQGFSPDSKLRCEKQISRVGPERIVINLRAV